jgi:hypothetical protein
VHYGCMGLYTCSPSGRQSEMDLLRWGALVLEAMLTVDGGELTWLHGLT